MTQDEAGRDAKAGGLAMNRGNAGSYRSETLFDGRQEIGISHRGQRYVLRITRQGKLILNKKDEVGHEQDNDEA
jgi:hemin uptake protein HemP